MSVENCEFRERCGFFSKFGARQSNVWRGLVGFYCTGHGHRLCERRKAYLEERPQMSDDLMPNGQEVSKAFQSLA
jgi:hypothetical protein